MRKMIILLALLTSSALFFLAATPSPASAANCTSGSVSPIYYAGQQWHFSALLSGCTGTSGARLLGYDRGNLTHIQDNSTGIIHNTLTLTLTYIGAASSYYWDGPSFSVWGNGCGSPPFSATKRFGWQIRNANGNTWGSVHQAQAPPQMLC